MLIYRETFLYKASTENLGHSNEESEHFKGSGVQFSCNQCYWKKNPANKENRNNKTKKNRLSKYMCYIQTEKTQNNKTLCWK